MPRVRGSRLFLRALLLASVDKLLGTSASHFFFSIKASGYPYSVASEVGVKYTCGASLYILCQQSIYVMVMEKPAVSFLLTEPAL